MRWESLGSRASVVETERSSMQSIVFSALETRKGERLMKWTTPGWNWLVAAMASVALFAFAGLVTAEPPAAETSTFAPAKDLVGQVDYYLERLEESVANPADFKDAEGKIARDSNTVILLALALGLHDTDNKYKAAAPAMVKAAQEVAAAKDYDAAKKAVGDLKKAGSCRGQLQWEKVASGSPDETGADDQHQTEAEPAGSEG